VITLVWFGIALLMRAYRQRRVVRRSRKARAGERRPAPAE
jgi:hypothetical protein